MKQQSKRIMSALLSVLMLVSMLSVYTFAENNFVRDDKFYDELVKDAVIVNPAWGSVQAGDEITFYYRDKEYKETFSPDTHFSSLNDAYEYCHDVMGDRQPKIILCEGRYSEKLTLKGAAEFYGPYAGMNPNVVSEDPKQPWGEAERTHNAVLNNIIEVGKTVNENMEVVFDGVTFNGGFAYIDGTSTTGKTTTSAVVRNTVMTAGERTNGYYGFDNITSKIYFASFITSDTSVKIENVRCTGMRTAGIVGTDVDKLEISGLYYADSIAPAVGSVTEGADAQKDKNASYVIKDSMFYNNTSSSIVVDHSRTDSGDATTRTLTKLEIYGCSFLDGDDVSSNRNALNSSPISYMICGDSNKLDVHDNIFVGVSGRTVSAIKLSCIDTVRSVVVTDMIFVNNNRFIGYYTLPDTTGNSSSSVFDFNYNYYAAADGNHHDPVFPSDASSENISGDYFWYDEDMTVSSSIFYLTTTGISNSRVDNRNRRVSGTVEFGTSATFNFATEDPDTTYVITDDEGNVVTELDSHKLVSGNDKNIYCATGTSPKVPGYEFKYDVYITTMNPALAVEFDIANTYMYDPSVASEETGTEVYRTWDETSYRFRVNENIFSTIDDIYAAAGEEMPTIIMPAGTYDKPIVISRPTILLGAKHGINPNIPQYSNPAEHWLINPERSLKDQETIISSVIAIDPFAVNVMLDVDGITFGPGGAFMDHGDSSIVTYNTTNLKNIVVDGEGSAGVGSVNVKGIQFTISHVISVSGRSESYKNDHIDLRVQNLRMVSQLNTRLIDDNFETLLLDGIYYENNYAPLTTSPSNEITHPKGQNLYFEIRNSKFIDCPTGSSAPFIVFNHYEQDSDETTSNTVVMENNTFWDVETYGWGVFGVRWTGAKDSLTLTNNTFYSTTAKSLIPGSLWFRGKSYFLKTDYLDSENNIIDQAAYDEALRTVDVLDKFYVRHNRFLLKNGIADPGMMWVNPKTRWDWNYNYFANATSIESGKAGGLQGSTVSNIECMVCDYWYKDFEMTELNAQPSDETFNTALDYSINGSGTIDENAKTYTDTVDADVLEYDFGIKLNTLQAKYGIYSDADCTQPVSEPVRLENSENVFYLKFSSYDGSVSDVYTATISRKRNEEAEILRFGNWKVTSNAVEASVPSGTSTFTIPEIQVTAGAEYAIYNDADCTQEFTDAAITDIGAMPVIKYILVTSETGVQRKYQFSIVPGGTPQSELTYIEGAKKTSDTEFEVKIPATKNGFDFAIAYSDGATVDVYRDENILKPVQGRYFVENVFDGVTIDFTVTNAGVSKKFTLNITKESSSIGIDSIFSFVQKDEYSFETWTNGTTYKVIPKFIGSNVSFGVYSDKECTNAFNDATVDIQSKNYTAYIKITSADGSNSKVYSLIFHTTANVVSDEPVATRYITVKNAEATNDGFVINAEDNISSIDIGIELNDPAYNATTFRVFADPSCNDKMVVSPEELAYDQTYTAKISAKNTVLYIRAKIMSLDAEGNEKEQDEEIVKLTIVSNRPTAEYSDAANISEWARGEVEFLNNNGFGYFQGDSDTRALRPKDKTSRFEIAVLAVRVLGIDTTNFANYSVPFEDSIPNWALDSVKTCYALGIMNGLSKNEFGGSKNTTRQEFAKIITTVVAIARGDALDEEGVKALYNDNKESIDATYNGFAFADADKVSSWADLYVRLAVAKYGLMNGSADNGNLNVNPANNIDRQEIAVILANYNGYTE